MAEHSPTPWRIDGQTIRDAENGVVVSALNPANMATRRLIVEAVNALCEAEIAELDPKSLLINDPEFAARARQNPSAYIEDLEREIRFAVAADARAGRACRIWREDMVRIRFERDRLRDLVRRLVHQFEGRATYDDEAAIIREAREAIGEAGPAEGGAE